MGTEPGHLYSARRESTLARPPPIATLKGVFILLLRASPPDQRTALRRSQRDRMQRYLSVVILGLVVWPVSLATGQDLLSTEGADMPDWSRAIVKIRVPVTRSENGYPRHFFEYCTGSRVRVPNSEDIQILTAWHCFDGFNRHLDQAQVASSDQSWHPVQLSHSGGSMAADWAWLKLPDTLPSVPALRLSTRDAHPTDTLIAAGFNRDDEIADGGNTLTFDPHCRIQSADPPLGSISSDCVAFKGASGGPVLMSTESGWVVAGIISAAMNELSLLVPSSLIATQ